MNNSFSNDFIDNYNDFDNYGNNMDKLNIEYAKVIFFIETLMIFHVLK